MQAKRKVAGIPSEQSSFGVARCDRDTSRKTIRLWHRDPRAQRALEARCWRRAYTDDSIEFVHCRFDGISIFQFFQTGQEQVSSNGIGDARRRDRRDGRHLSLFDLDVGPPVTSIRFSCHVTGSADGESL